MFEELFIRKTVDIQKAVMFGFVQNNSNYIYETDILDGTFLLQIIITPRWQHRYETDRKSNR